MTINYKSNRNDAFGQNHHESICPIDIKSLEGTDAATRNWEEKAIKELKRIADILHKSSTGSNSLKIKIQNKDPYEIAKEEDLKKSNNLTK
ncbi:MAG: hypothetical protein AB7F21_12860 [Desulfuromonadales bacterium]